MRDLGPVYLALCAILVALVMLYMNLEHSLGAVAAHAARGLR